MPAITNVTELQNMNLDLTGTYWLSNDIDASATSGWNGGLGFAPVGDFASKFTGSFDGRGFTISNLMINRPTQDYIGLFGWVDGATIEDIAITGTMTGKDYVAGIAGVVDNVCVFDNCNTNITIIAEDYSAGGIAGDINGASTFTNCFAVGNISGLSAPGLGSGYGGFAGNSYGSATFTDCYATGNVSGVDDYPGGFIGSTWDAETFTRCYATGNISAVEYAPGGFVGEVNGPATFTDCYATGSVSCNDYGAGGFVGETYGGTFIRCYATGDVQGFTVTGGFCGGSWDDFSSNVSTYTNCYSAGNVTGTDWSTGGFCGYGWDNSVFTESYATGDVIGPDNAGGFVGSLWDEVQIARCFATGNVTCPIGAGGFAGTIWSEHITITDAYSWGNVVGDDRAGGFAGSINYSIQPYTLDLINCYSVGEVSGTVDVGGFIGKDIPSVSLPPQPPGTLTVISCYWDTVTSGQATSVVGTGKTTAEMMVEPTFVGYDFVSTWEFVICRDYPVFQYQNETCTLSVNFTREPSGNVNIGDKIKFLPEIIWT